MSRTAPLLLLLTLATAAGCSGCGGSTTISGDTLIYGRGSDARTLDPVDATIGETIKVIHNLYDTIVAYDMRTAEIVPHLAKSWEHSEDGLTWTFKLRDDVTFHDGTPLDAEAVVFTLKRLTVPDHPHVHHGAPPYGPNFESIQSVQAVDATTVEIQLKRPSAVLLKNLALHSACIVSPTAVKKHGKDFEAHPVGTGPYKLLRWDRGQRIILEANPDYFLGPPKSERIIFIPVAENAVRVAQLKRGEIHLADNLPPNELAALEGTPGIAFQQNPGANVAYIACNTERKLTGHPKARAAIWHALDKQRLIDVAYAGEAKTAATMVPPTIEGHHDGLSDRPYNLDEAKRLLEEAAAEEGVALPVEWTLFVMRSPRPYVQEPLSTARFIRDALEPIGINIDLVLNDNLLHFQRLSQGEHDLGLAGWSADTMDPDSFLFSLLDPSNINDQGGNNLSRYDNPELAKLLLEGQRELDPQRRAEIYREAQEIVWRDAPTIPLVHTPVQLAQRAELKGYYLHPASIVRLRNAYLAPEAP